MSYTAAEIQELLKRLTPEERAEVDRLLGPVYPKAPTLTQFIDETTSFKSEPWQRLIDMRLEALLEQTGQRILFHAPPQFGKSIRVSQRFPAYGLGVKPLHRFRLACYNETHATEFTGINLDLMQSDYFKKRFPNPACRVPKVAKASRFSTMAREHEADGQPSLVALGIGSGFTGLGVDTLIVDDPYKNAEEAYSETIRESVWRWFRMVVMARVNPTSNIVVMFHRWHMDDLAGRLLQQGGWELIRMPAICDGDDVEDPTVTELGRKAGETLSPRYPVPFLEGMRDTIGESEFNALFQGKPVAEGGNLIKSAWWRYWGYQDDPDAKVRELPKHFDEVIIAGDGAMSERSHADYTVCWVIGRIGASAFILDRIRGQWNTPQVLERLGDLIKKWPQALAKYIEAESIGKAIADLLHDKFGGIITVSARHELGDKMTRVKACLPIIEAGNVYLPYKTLVPWVQEFLDEASAFPVGSHDDQVDALTLGLLKLRHAMDSAAPTSGDKAVTGWEKLMAEKVAAEASKGRSAYCTGFAR